MKTQKEVLEEQLRDKDKEREIRDKEIEIRDKEIKRRDKEIKSRDKVIERLEREVKEKARPLLRLRCDHDLHFSSRMIFLYLLQRREESN